MGMEPRMREHDLYRPFQTRVRQRRLYLECRVIAYSRGARCDDRPSSGGHVRRREDLHAVLGRVGGVLALLLF